MSTLEYLRNFGFSKQFIAEFFRCFYGGIFLEQDLSTSSRSFEFTFKMFATGSAALPAEGMQAIPRQLAARLPGGSIRCGIPVESVGRTAVFTHETKFGARNLVVATDGDTAARLTGVSTPRWNSTTCLYFSAGSDPIGKPILMLRGDRKGMINHVCVPSTVAPNYAPEGKSLVSVSLADGSGAPDLEHHVRAELRGWFGASVDSWTHLRTDTIQKALPEALPARGEPATAVTDGLFVCGDHTTNASIEGAIISGLRAAEKIIG